MDNTYECDLCDFPIQNQEHLMDCLPLRKRVPRNDNVEYGYIFGTMDQQAEIVELYARLLEEKENIGGVPTGANFDNSGPCITSY